MARPPPSLDLPLHPDIGPPGLNAVEGFFAKLTRRRLKRGVFRSVAELKAAILRFINEANHDPKPFVWTANPHKVLAAVNRGRQVLDGAHIVIADIAPGNDTAKMVEQAGRRVLACTCDVFSVDSQDACERRH